MNRRSKLTEKDMSTLREADNARVQKEKSHGSLIDYSLNHRVTMSWDLNDEAKRDMIFKLKIDDIEVLLDWEQIARLGRFI